MKLKFRIAGAALLATAMAPAWALQVGQIEVKSALNQPLVAAIPLHPKNLSELDGLTVQLASPADFTRAGLQLTATDQTLRFHVVTDNNGQKLILVTSSQPVSDPYLDFLVEVNTRQGKQVREFVVLLNPVIAAPAPAVQTAPVATSPVAAPPPHQPAELPVPPPEAVQPAPPAKASTPTQPQAQQQATPKPQAQPQPESAAQKPTQSPTPPKPLPAPQPPSPSAAPASQTIPVRRGDTLYEIAKDATPDTGATVNQMMMALKSANPEAFFKNNINNLKAGAILRIPTREEIDQNSIAEANTEVHRQYEVWRSARPHPATVVEGTAAKAAAQTAPNPAPVAPASDHLALVPPSGGASGAGSRPGVAGGTGSETVAGMQQRLQNERGTLTSLEQSNADLESRARSLEDLTGKSGKLLSFKEATVAELQRKLAAVQSGKPLAAASSAAVATATANGGQPGASATVAAKPAGKAAAARSPASATPWFERPLTWIVAAVIALALILLGLLSRRRGGRDIPAGAEGPLTDPEDLSPQTGTVAYRASLEGQLAENPGDLGPHLALCRLYHAEGDVARFVAAAEAMHVHVREPGSLEWHEVAVMGEELAPGNPLFAAPVEELRVMKVNEEPEGVVPQHEPAPNVDDAATAPPAEVPKDEVTPEADPGWSQMTSVAPLPVTDATPEVQPEPAVPDAGATDFNDDPVDTKLDLARAYLDMGDPVGARAMLDEVLEEGSQLQQDEARRLLAETSD
ncbi:MAG: FimV/HubP family polar landmark protein [Rhodanobacteraceae bacterium]